MVHLKVIHVGIAGDLGHDVATEQVDAAVAHGGDHLGADLASGVDHRLDRQTLVIHAGRQFEDTVVVADHRDWAVDGPQCELARIAEYRAGQHDAGCIVVGEHERALDAARSEHDLLGDHLPDLPLPAARAGSVRDLAQDDHVAASVDAGYGAAVEDAQVVEAAQREFGVGEPLVAGHAVDCRGAPQQAAAQRHAVVGQDHPCTGIPRGQRRHQSGGSAAHHQHIAMGKAGFGREVGPHGRMDRIRSRRLRLVAAQPFHQRRRRPRQQAFRRQPLIEVDLGGEDGSGRAILQQL